MALELTSEAPAAPATTRAARGLRVSAKDRLFFTEQLALLLDTGASLHGALQTLTRQSRGEKLSALLTDLSEHISGGRSFSEALARHPKTFDSTYVNLVSAGEEGGFLPRVLEQLMSMEERRAKLRSDVVSAVSYPAFLLAFSLAVVIFVLVVVFPKFDMMFGSIADKLPATTKILMAVSEILRGNAIVIGVVVAALAVIGWRWAVSASGRSLWETLAIRTPLIRSIFVPLYLIQSFRVMSMSLGNGVAVVDTLTACRDVVSNHIFGEFIDSVERTVRDGAGIAVAFRQAAFMPDLVKEMIATGEESGALPKVMDRVAGFYERDLEKRLAMIARLAEPVMLVVMGLVVGVLVSSLILPIFQLSSSAR